MCVDFLAQDFIPFQFVHAVAVSATLPLLLVVLGKTCCLYFLFLLPTATMQPCSEVGAPPWDTYMAEGDAFPGFHVYVCCAVLLHWSEELRRRDFTEMMMFVQWKGSPRPPARSLAVFVEHERAAAAAISPLHVRSSGPAPDCLRECTLWHSSSTNAGWHVKNCGPEA